MVAQAPVTLEAQLRSMLGPDHQHLTLNILPPTSYPLCGSRPFVPGQETGRNGPAFICLVSERALCPARITQAQEDNVRTPVLAALFSIAISSAALADASVAGNWHANLDSGVSIDMKVSPNGAWSSETHQHNKVVRQMKGTYQQTPADNGTGTIVFTPKQASVKNGPVEVETDQYELADNGRQLKLTADGDTMVFKKR
jgi:hypothetical protein